MTTWIDVAIQNFLCSSADILALKLPACGSQGNGSNWGGLSGNANQAALQAQALALQLQLAGGLDQGAASYLTGAPNSLTAYAQQQYLQQQLQNLSLQTNLSLQQNTAALLAKVIPSPFVLVI